MQGNKAPSRCVCHDIVFSITQEKGPSYLLNRYKLGRIQAGTLVLNPYECLYLFLKGKIESENPLFNRLDRLVERLGMGGRYLDLFIIYNTLKNRGFYLKIEGESLFYRRTPRNEYSGPVRVIRESEDIEFRELIDNGGCIYAALDDDNDITVFISGMWDEHGSNPMRKAAVEVTDVDGIYLARAGTVPDWYGTDFGDFRMLNRSEAGHLDPGLSRRDDTMAQEVFNDLISRDFIVKTGFKYGANFRIYAGTIEEHADYLVHVLESREQWYKISRAVRVAQGVRKEMVFSSLVEGIPKYIKLRRVRDPFSSSD